MHYKFFTSLARHALQVLYPSHSACTTSSLLVSLVMHYKFFTSLTHHALQVLRRNYQVYVCSVSICLTISVLFQVIPHMKLKVTSASEKLAFRVFRCGPSPCTVSIKVSTTERVISGNPRGVPRLLPTHAQCVNYVMEIFMRFGRGRLVLTRLDVARFDV